MIPRVLPAVPLLLLALTAGCTQPQFRSQKEEESDKDRYLVRTVGEVSTIGNAEPVVVSGVGLVEGLEGTGCPAPPGEMRQMIEAELRKAKVHNTREVLGSNDCAIVLVQAVLPAGVKKGEKVDVEVALPPGSKATSLRGGYLRRCTLHNYDYAGNISSRYANTNATLKGSPIVRAEGALLVGMNGGPEDKQMKRGRIWGGGLALIDRQFHIVLNAKNQFAAVSSKVAGRINTAFQGSVTMTPGHELALAKTSSIILLNVPPQYRLNVPRYLRVVRLVPIEEIEPAKNAPPRLPYRDQLREDLLDPARSVVAALRLEALGSDSLALLKPGLESPHPLVRFCAAEAIAYLGNPRCGEELARVVEQQPYLRSFALTAMASLDEAVCHVKLKELMNSELDDESRYGAFRALRTLDENDAEVRGENLNDTFWLHEVNRTGKPLVHLSTSRRAEIVLFGKDVKLTPPFTLVAGEFALTAAKGDQAATLSHVVLSEGDDSGTSRTRCPLELSKVIRLLAREGASYPEVIEMIRQADACKNLSCRVRNDALPQAVTVEQLAQAARQDKDDAQEQSLDRVELIKPDASFGATPTLYEKETVRRK